MEFPLIDPKELRAAIEFQAQEAIPIPLDEAILDFQVLSTTPWDGEGAGRQQVLIVAAQRDMIGQFMQVAKKAGLAGLERHRPAGVRAHAVRRPAGGVRRSGGPAGGRRQRAHQHRRRHQQPRGLRRYAAVHTCGQPGIRGSRPGAHSEPRGDPPGGRHAPAHRGSQRECGRGRRPRGHHGERDPRGVRLDLRVLRGRDPPLDRLLPLAAAGRAHRAHPPERRGLAHAQHVRLPRRRPASAGRSWESTSVHRREQIQASSTGA